jgi:SAM-dependent methyltransferase
MTNGLEREVAAHYGKANLTARILEALRIGGLDAERLNVKDLGAVDEFHLGGRPATEFLLSRMQLDKQQHVLDVGCGIGGAARYIAATAGCRVTGIDLTPEYIETARDLTRRTGLSDRVAFEVGSALDMPFRNASFDVGLTIHAAMNIKDRGRLYAEVARVLKPGARFYVYDIMQGPQAGLRFPVPWAETEATSHLTTPAEMTELLGNAGFDIEETINRKEEGLAFFRERFAAAEKGPPPVGLHLIMDNARTKLENAYVNLEQDRIAPVVMMARRR